MNYPVAEDFDSIQGEGLYVGTRMHFIRLAGCNVGRAPSRIPRLALSEKLFEMHPTHTVCTSVFGQHFLCDTDYRATETLTTQEILARVKCDRLCITGGEPFLHDLTELVWEARRLNKVVHIETSGTCPIPDDLGRIAHIVCSPKQGLLPDNKWFVSEWKFVIGVEHLMTDDELIHNIYALTTPTHTMDRVQVYVQPINTVDGIDPLSLARCLTLVQLDSKLRLSVQLHKLLNVR